LFKLRMRSRAAISSAGMYLRSYSIYMQIGKHDE